jgi:hypothetical protein
LLAVGIEEYRKEKRARDLYEGRWCPFNLPYGAAYYIVEAQPNRKEGTTLYAAKDSQLNNFLKWDLVLGIIRPISREVI